MESGWKQALFQTITISFFHMLTQTQHRRGARLRTGMVLCHWQAHTIGAIPALLPATERSCGRLRNPTAHAMLLGRV
jgi:hypothetical protein